MQSYGGESCCSDERVRTDEVIAGNEYAIEVLRELITFPILYPREGRELGLRWPRNLLLYGPQGTGKTSLIRAVTKECGAHLIEIRFLKFDLPYALAIYLFFPLVVLKLCGCSPESVRRAHAGESEKALRDVFAKALSLASSGRPSVVSVDKVDVLCPHRDSRRQQDVWLASQLLTLLDCKKASLSSQSHVVVVASTNRLDALDPALRRAGRFDVEVEVGMPNEEDRLKILKLYTKAVHLDSTVDLHAIASSCNGYVGADLEFLCWEASISAMKRPADMSENEGIPKLTMEDWERAKSVSRPCIKRGITIEIPKVTWNDIGGLKELKKKLKQAVEWPVKHSDVFSRMGLSPIRGILLHGPPGCSKTTLVKAAANAAQTSFISFSCADLYSMYVGEGEALLRSTFQRARLAAPSIIFFDEVDVVAGKRGGSSSQATVGERLLSTLLTEMDGLEEAKGILVLAATNRPYAVDPALMRPGRFDLVLYVPPPDTEARYEILQVHTRKNKLENDVDLRRIAEDTELFTGAELQNLCKEAAMVALREDIAAACTLGYRHFQIARDSLKPAMTAEKVAEYSSFMMSQPRKSCGARDLEMQDKNGTSSLIFSAKFGFVCSLLAAAGNYLFFRKQSRHDAAAT